MVFNLTFMLTIELAEEKPLCTPSGVVEVEDEEDGIVLRERDIIILQHLRHHNATFLCAVPEPRPDGNVQLAIRHFTPSTRREDAVYLEDLHHYYLPPLYHPLAPREVNTLPDYFRPHITWTVPTHRGNFQPGWSLADRCTSSEELIDPFDMA